MNMTYIHQLEVALKYSIEISYEQKCFVILHTENLQIVDINSLHKNIVNEAFDMFDDLCYSS